VATLLEVSKILAYGWIHDNNGCLESYLERFPLTE